MVFSDERRRIAHYVDILCADKATNSGHKAKWDIPKSFKYVILTYRKAQTLKNYTWAYLKKCSIPDNRILIVVQNPQCYADYANAGFPKSCLVEIATSGYRDAFNQVFSGNGSGQPPLVGIGEVIVQMDDDIVGLASVGRKLYPSGRPQPMQVLNLDAVMVEQMQRMEVSGCNLAGFDPCPNHGWIYKNVLFAKHGDHLGLRFVIGQARVIRKQGLQIAHATGKSDYELTFRYFEADGGVLRSNLQIKAKDYAGGCATDGEMAEALLLKKHFPREIPGAPKEHTNGTTSLKLVGMSFGEGRMLNLMKRAMAERLGETLCNRVVTEIEAEIMAEKHLEKLKHVARKHLSDTQLLPLLRKEYVALMTERYGAEFDSDEAMVPFRTFTAETYNKFSDPLKRGKDNAVRGDVSRKARCGEEAVRIASAALRSSAMVLDHVRDRKYEDRVALAPTVKKRKNLCKLCGELGHYAKACPQQDMAKVSGERENMSKSEVRLMRRKELAGACGKVMKMMCKRPAKSICKKPASAMSAGKTLRSIEKKRTAGR